MNMRLRFVAVRVFPVIAIVDCSCYWFD